MRDFFFGRQDDSLYQYCPEGENNVLITPKETEVLIASQNPEGNTARDDQMPYQCVAYCTGGSTPSAESGEPSEGSGNEPIFETCDNDGNRPPSYECPPDHSCGQNSECVLDNEFNESCICTLGYEFVDNNCEDIDECEAGTHQCGTGQCFNLEGTYRCNTTVDIVWAVDGTGSYKIHIPTAQTNFREQIDYFKSKREEGLEFRMGLTFFSDRFFAKYEMSDSLYHCALPLTDISMITNKMISDAFASMNKMYYGGDDEEDVLMGESIGHTVWDISYANICWR